MVGQFLCLPMELEWRLGRLGLDTMALMGMRVTFVCTNIIHLIGCNLEIKSMDWQPVTNVDIQCHYLQMVIALL